MRGQEPLIAMRRAGKVPRSVWFCFDGDGWRIWPASAYRRGGVAAEVLIEPADNIDRLDLRFVVGLQCRVQGNDAAKVRKVHAACAKAGAARVLSVVMAANERGVERVADMLDTAGVLVGA